MAILSARELKARESPESVLDVGDGGEVRVRRPDLQTLVFAGAIAPDTVDLVLRLAVGWAGLDADQALAEMIRHGAALSAFIDAWVCAALVAPRAVLRAEDVTADAVHVEDLTIALRLAVFAQTFDGARVGAQLAVRRHDPVEPVAEPVEA